MTIVRKLCLLLMYSLLLLPALCYLPAQAGNVGFQRQIAPDPDGAPLEVAIWYPSQAAAAPLATGAISQTVALDGPIAGSKLPLIVISHGTGGSYLSHYDTALALAQAGFIVVAPSHTGDTYQDQRRSLYILERPRHISRVLDYMLSGWQQSAAIDPGRIGMFGFSAGGFTTLVSIGGQPDMRTIAPFCSDHASHFACQLLARSQASAQQPSAPGAQGTADPRIKAAVVAAPALGFSFAQVGLDHVSVPVQLWRAEDDTILPAPWYAEPVRAALPHPPEYEVVAHAGHFDFLAPCSTLLAARAPEICRSAPGFDRQAFHQRFNDKVVRFLREQLGGTQ
jgi:predicted dienelactone hydrolase